GPRAEAGRARIVANAPRESIGRALDAHALASGCDRLAQPGRGNHEAMTSPLHRLTRRAFLGHTGLGLGGAALALLNAQSRGGESLAAKKPHHEPTAKHIIYMHMIGAPSQLDLLDPKPALLQWDGKPCPEEMTRGKRF